MDFYPILVIIILMSAVFSYVNHKWIKWPQTIGIMSISLITSLLLVFFGRYSNISTAFKNQIISLDFKDILMKYMLGLLLFAGGFQIKAMDLKKNRLSILTLSTLGTILSTFIIGFLTFFVFKYFSHPIPLIYCLLFGSAISPTDPIAVLSILKEQKIPYSLELKIEGESLFNDGVAVVLFTTIFQLSINQQNEFQLMEVFWFFIRQGFGGILYGWIIGYLGYIAIKSIDDYKVEILITLALVMAGYYFAGFLQVSGPLAMVVAGLITGGKTRDIGMSPKTKDYLTKFWEMINEIFNTILFLLIGLEMLVVKINSNIFGIGLIMIIAVLIARWVSVAFPVLLLKPWGQFEKNSIKILTWSGLRGGLSVALALSLPSSAYRDEFIAITYIIVVFSILVQGLTIGQITRVSLK
jgi:CPA1 family monovalent cation:H+ antiporter